MRTSRPSVATADTRPQTDTLPRGKVASGKESLDSSALFLSVSQILRSCRRLCEAFLFCQVYVIMKAQYPFLKLKGAAYVRAISTAKSSCG